jgi:SSS family solute:Na+ symporter
LFTIDFYARLRPQTSQERLVWIGRFATAVMVAIGILWIPVIKGGKGLYDYLQGMQAYLAPPIFVVFFFGVFWKRLNAKGCMAALIAGFGMGIVRLAIDTPVKLMHGFHYPEGTFLWVMNNVFFQYYSLLIFLVSAAVMIIVSFATEAPELERISGLTYGTVTDEHKRESRASWDARDVVSSALVLALILAAYLYFVG